jgi:hypothetical protein
MSIAFSLGCCLLPFLLLVLAPQGAGAADTVRVRVSLAQKDAVWVGQKVTLQLVVLTSTWFSHEPTVHLPQVSGVALFEKPIVKRPESERIDGATWSGIYFEFLVFPLRPGEHVLPSFPIRATPALPGSTPQEVEVQTPALRLVAQLPPGAEDFTMLITTTELTVDERWEPQIGPAKVGDAFTHVVRLQAPDVVGMALPPLPDLQLNGLGTYPKAPEVHDQLSRGDLIGERQEAVTYVCEQPGTYTVPAVVIPWWDVDEQQLKRVVLPAVTFTVAPNPVLASEGGGGNAVATARSPRHTWGVIAGLSVLTLVAVSLWLWRQRLSQHWHTWSQRRADREAGLFAQLQQACHSGNAAQTFSTLMLWLDRLYDGAGSATIEEFVQQCGDPDLAQELEALQLVVVTPATPWSGVRLARMLRQVRQTIRRRHLSGARSPLPQLNP